MVEKKTGNGQAGQMMYVSNAEALELIESLSRQLRSGANRGRSEFVLRDGSYFSVVAGDGPEADD